MDLLEAHERAIRIAQRCADYVGGDEKEHEFSAAYYSVMLGLVAKEKAKSQGEPKLDQESTSSQPRPDFTDRLSRNDNSWAIMDSEDSM